MQFEGAVVTEQGITFAIVVVKKHVIDSNTEAKSAIEYYQRFFPGLPITLMAQDSTGRPYYKGERSDIVRFLANIDFRRIPWKKYTAT